MDGICNISCKTCGQVIITIRLAIHCNVACHLHGLSENLWCIQELYTGLLNTQAHLFLSRRILKASLQHYINIVKDTHCAI